jgi:hypothetical protein
MQMPPIYYKAMIAIRQRMRIYKFRWMFFKRALSNYWRLRFGIIAFIVLGLIIYFASWSGNNPIFKLGDRSTWQNIASELHGLLFDVLLFGIVFVIFEKVRDKKEVITRYLEELDDYRGWDSPEAYQRIHGLLRRLINEQFFRIDMSDIYMKNQKVNKPLNLEFSVFQRASLENSEFYSTYFISPSFVATDFYRTRFDYCNFDSATFSTPVFRGTIFESCHFNSTAFHGLKVSPEFKPSVYFRDCKFTVTDFKHFNVFSITGFVNCSFDACEAYEYQKPILEKLDAKSGITYLPNPPGYQDRSNAEEQILQIQ